MKHTKSRIARNNQEEQLAKLSKDSLKQFEEAGRLFVQLNEYYLAGTCYFSAKNYQRALDLYLHRLDWNEAAQAAERNNNFYLAGMLYWKNQDYETALDSFILSKNYAILFQFIFEYYEYFEQETTAATIKSYIEPFLAQLWKNSQNQLEILGTAFYEELNVAQINLQNCGHQYQVEFREQFALVENVIQFFKRIVVQDDFMKVIYRYIAMFKQVFLDMASSIFINYNVTKYSTAFDDGQNLSYEKYKIIFITDLLEILELDILVDFVYDFYTEQDRYKQLISQLFKKQSFFQQHNRIPFMQIYSSYFDTNTPQGNKVGAPRQQKQEQSKPKFCNNFQLEAMESSKPYSTFALLKLGYWSEIADCLHQIDNQSGDKEALYANYFKYKYLMENDFNLQNRKKYFMFYYFKQLSKSTSLMQLPLPKQESAKEQLLKKQDKVKGKLQKLLADCDIFDCLKIRKFNNTLLIGPSKYQSTFVIQQKFIYELLHEFDGDAKYIIKYESMSQKSQMEYLEILLMLIWMVEFKMDDMAGYNLNYVNYQKLILLLQMCANMFKYNELVNQQRLIFEGICGIYQLSIPDETLLYALSSQYLFVKVKSKLGQLAVQDINAQGENKLCQYISAAHDVYSVPTISILKVQKKHFQTKLNAYVKKYQKTQCSIVEKHLFINLQCVYTIIKLKVNEQCENKVMQETAKKSFFSLVCVKKQFFIQQQVPIIQFTKMTKEANIESFESLMFEQFIRVVKANTDLLLHKHLIRALLLGQLLHRFDYCYEFLRQLETLAAKNYDYAKQNHYNFRKSNPFLSVSEVRSYNNYLRYLETVNNCFTSKGSEQLFQYLSQNQLADNNTFQQIFWKDIDITLVTLLVTYKGNSINQPMVLYLPRKMKDILKLCKEKKQQDQQIQQSNEDAESKSRYNAKIVSEELIHSEIELDKLVQKLVIKHKRQELQYSQLIVYLTAIIVNTNNTNKMLSQRLSKQLNYLQKQDQLEQIELLEEIMDLDLERKLGKLFGDRKLIVQPNIQFTSIILVRDMPGSYIQQRNLSKELQQEVKENLQNAVYQFDKQKFPKQNMALTIILSKNVQQIGDKYDSSKFEVLKDFYDDICKIRQLLLTILHTEQIKKSSQFHAIIWQLDYLVYLKDSINQWIGPNWIPYQAINRVRDEIVEFLRQINIWRQQKQVNEQLQQVDREAKKQQQKEKVNYNMKQLLKNAYYQQNQKSNNTNKKNNRIQFRN